MFPDIQNLSIQTNSNEVVITGGADDDYSRIQPGSYIAIKTSAGTLVHLETLVSGTKAVNNVSTLTMLEAWAYPAVTGYKGTIVVTLADLLEQTSAVKALGELLKNQIKARSDDLSLEEPLYSFPISATQSIIAPTLAYLRAQLAETIDDAQRLVLSLKGMRESTYRSIQSQYKMKTQRDGVLTYSDVAADADVIQNDLFVNDDTYTVLLGFSKPHHALINCVEFAVKHINNASAPGNRLKAPRSATARKYSAGATSDVHAKYDFCVIGNDIYQAKTAIVAGTDFTDTASFLKVDVVRQRYICIPLYREVTLGDDTGEFDYVAPGGLLQQSIANYSGQQLTGVNAPFYEGDDFSGMAAQWSVMSEENRNPWLMPENKIFVDSETGKYKQGQLIYRYFPILGMGWDKEAAIEQIGTIIDVKRGTYLIPGTDGLGNYITCINEAFIYTTTNDAAFHDFYNKLAAGRWRLADNSGDDAWHSNPTVNAANVADCFDDQGGANRPDFTTGNKSSGASARPDGGFYDVIKPWQIRYCFRPVIDKKVTTETVLGKIRWNEIRGNSGVQLFHRFSDNTVTVGGSAIYGEGNNSSTYFPVSDATNGLGNDRFEFQGINATHWILVAQNGKSMIIRRVNQLDDLIDWPRSNNLAFLRGSGDVVDIFNDTFQPGDVLFVAAYSMSDEPVSGEYPTSDIIGTVAEIKSIFDRLGVATMTGGWIPVFPDNSSKPYKNTRKAIQYFNRVYSIDGGVNWFSDALYNPVGELNAHTQDYASNVVVIQNYSTSANAYAPVTFPQFRSETGPIFITNSGDVGAATFCFHVTGSVPTGSGDNHSYTLTELYRNADGVSYHSAVTLEGSSDGCKCQVIFDDMDCYIIANALKHNGLDYGDTGTLLPVDNRGKVLDDNFTHVSAGTFKFDLEGI